MSARRRPEENIRCSKRLTMTCGLRPVAQPLVDRLDQLLGVAQARHRHLADDEQLVGAEQHAVGPREPGARHVEHDVVEIATRPDRAAASPRRDRTSASRPADCGAATTARPGGVVRQHDLEQLAVETVRPRLDLAEVEARLEVEIVGAGAVLEIEIDQAGRGSCRAGRC